MPVQPTHVRPQREPSHSAPSAQRPELASPPPLDTLSLGQGAGLQNRSPAPHPGPDAPGRPAGSAPAAGLPPSAPVGRTKVHAVITEADALFDAGRPAAALARLESVADAPAATASFKFQTRLGMVLAAVSDASVALPEVTLSNAVPPAPVVRWTALDLMGRAHGAYNAALNLASDPEVQASLRETHGAAHLPRILGAVAHQRLGARVEFANLAKGLARVNGMPATDTDAAARIRQFSAASVRSACLDCNEALGDEGRLAAWTLWACEAERPLGNLRRPAPGATRVGLPADEAPVSIRQSQFDSLVQQVRAGALGADVVGGLTAQIEAMLERQRREQA